MLRTAAFVVALGSIATGVLGTAGPAHGQSVAYIPVPGQAFTGSTLGVTPVVSADRRYVRLGVDAYFNDVNGFSNFSVPAAVSGGGSGNFNAGMNGVIGPAGLNMGTELGSPAFAGTTGGLTAGPLPASGRLGAGSALAQGVAFTEDGVAIMGAWPLDGFEDIRAWQLPAPNRSGIRSGKRATKAIHRERRLSRKSAPRRESSAATSSGSGH